MIRITPAQYPRRLWGLYGPPGVGKSTFAARLRGPLLVIDADGRFAEVAGLAAGDVFGLSADPADLRDAERIAELIHAQRGELSAVRTVICDSLTPIIAPLVAVAILANDAGANKNKAAAFKPKALAARLLADALTAPGCDALMIWHEHDGRDAKGQAATSQTLPPTERARLLRNLNLVLRMVIGDDGRRGVQVTWARRGRSGAVLWDDSGSWLGMPERIERAVYDGLTSAQQAQLEEDPPTFPGREAALAWGWEQGAFEALQHAANAYDALKRETIPPPATAAEMWALWKADVRRRAAERAAREGAKNAAAEAPPAATDNASCEIHKARDNASYATDPAHAGASDRPGFS